MSARPMRLTTAQAARLAGVEVDTVRQWRHRGHVKGGPRWIDGRSLLNHLDRRAGKPPKLTSANTSVTIPTDPLCPDPGETPGPRGIVMPGEVPRWPVAGSPR